MTRVRTVVEVFGAIPGFIDDETLRIKFTILTNGKLLGFVASSPASATHVVLESGKASVDLMETTHDRRVFTSRFTLTKFDHRRAKSIDCVARLSSDEGLTGRWNVPGALNAKASNDTEFTMPAMPAGEVVMVAEAFGVGKPVYLVGFTGLGRDREIDEDTKLTLCVTFARDGRLHGTSMESGKRCKIAGTWMADTVVYEVEIPSEDQVLKYTHVGAVRKDTDGSAMLIGSWKPAPNNEVVGASSGEFHLVLAAPEEVNELMLSPGLYVFKGTATSRSNVQYPGKMTLALAADGNATGESDELALGTTWNVAGSWVNVDGSVSVIVSYGSSKYEYVGEVQGHQFVGKWLNSDPAAANDDNQNGDFIFQLESFEGLKDGVMPTFEKKAETPEETVSVSNPIAPGEYMLAGTASGGYGAEVTLTLSEDGKVTGKSNELSLGSIWDVNGDWKVEDGTVEYVITLEGSTITYNYKGKLENDTFAGTWGTFASTQGTFDFKIKSITPSVKVKDEGTAEIAAVVDDADALTPGDGASTVQVIADTQLSVETSDIVVEVVTGASETGGVSDSKTPEETPVDTESPPLRYPSSESDEFEVVTKTASLRDLNQEQ